MISDKERHIKRILAGRRHAQKMPHSKKIAVTKKPMSDGRPVKTLSPTTRKVIGYKRSRPRPNIPVAEVPVPVVPPVPRTDSITVQAAQGLGDIYWTYQKLAPLFKEIHLEVCVIALDKVQERSMSWLSMFPQIKSHKLRLMKENEYSVMAATKYDLNAVVNAWNTTNIDSVKYNCNRWLEEGTRLEEIDDNPVLESVALPTEEFDLPFKDYITLYVSGSTRHSSQPVWSLEQWIEFVQGIYSKYNVKLPVVTLGAEYDRIVANENAKLLSAAGIENSVFVSQSPQRVCHLLKNSKLFLGYQSGLNVIADNFDVPQVMLYFNYLDDMRYTWCKKKNMYSKFQAAIFSDSPKALCNRLKLDFLKG